MTGLLAAIPHTMANTSAAGDVMRAYVAPVVKTMSALASLVCVFFLINGGFHYMTSAGHPERLEHAKKVIRNALIGLVVVLAATALTAILTHAYGNSNAAANANLPNLTAITPAPVSNGVVGIIIKAITGVLNDIIQSLASPFISSLAYFTKATPLLADNPAVFNMWLAVVGMSDALFVLVIALLGFHIMSLSTFGFDEIEFKHLLPRLALIFLAVNTSLFAIDGVIELSNAMINALSLANGTTSLWDALTDVVKQSASLGLPSLLIMIAFTIFSVVLVVYYVGRLLTLYIGAVLSPLVLLLWLIPGFRDFAETAAKVYLVTIFVLFVHVVILVLAASLFAGVIVGSPTQTTGSLMPMITGLAAIIAILKTQGLMMQFSYASMGPRSVRKLGGQFMTGVSYLGGKSKAAAVAVNTRRSESSKTTSSSSSSTQSEIHHYAPKNTSPDRLVTKTKSNSKTGTTTVAPKSEKSKETEKP